MNITPKYRYKTTPFDHQREALKASWMKPYFAFFMEMGTGKTKVAIDEMSAMFEAGLIDAVVILPPKGVYMNWINYEIPAHMPDDVLKSATIVEWRSGGGSKSYRQFLTRVARDKSTSFPILVMNIEALSSGTKGSSYLSEFMKDRRCYVVVDESTFIKNPSASRTKRVVTLCAGAKYRRIMTGSPVTRSPLDLYSQFEFLGSRLLGFGSYYSFRARYAILKEIEWVNNSRIRRAKIVVGYRNLSELTEKVQRHSFRVTKDECLDLPSKIYIRRSVELTKEQRRIYDEIKREAIAFLSDGKTVTTAAVITQILRLHQTVCGILTDDDGNVVDIENNRLRELLSAIEESSGKIVIWSRYRRNIDQIVETLKKSYGEEAVAEYHGGNSGTRQTDVYRFLNDPKCRFMVSNQQSGGYGNTWTVATTMIYYSNDYDLEKRIQSEDRAHRSGQTEHVTYVDLVCPETVDELILRALRKKINISDAIMGDGYREWIV